MFELKRVILKPEAHGPYGAQDSNEYLGIITESNVMLVYDNAMSWHVGISDIEIMDDWQEIKEVERIVEVPVEVSKHVSPKDYFGQELSSITFK